MANYPPYQYQPQQMGYQPQMQPMFQQYQQPAPAPAQQSMQDQFYCRPVASEEEGRAIPVDFSGKPIIMPHFNAGKIYVKIFDTGSGSAIFQTYRREDPEAEKQPSVAFAPMSEVEQLKQIVFDLQNELRAIKGGKRKAQQEVVADEL